MGLGTREGPCAPSSYQRAQAGFPETLLDTVDPPLLQRSQVAKHGNIMLMALATPGIMIVNGAVFLSIFNGVSKLMASKARRGGWEDVRLTAQSRQQ